MTDVVIAGIGQTPVGEHWNYSLRSLAAKAMLAALQDVDGIKPQAVYVANCLASMASHQSNLGTLLADNAGLDHVEAYTVEASGASGGAALRMAYLAVRSGYVQTALAVGVEKVTDKIGPDLETLLAMELDNDYEGLPGLTETGQAALLMQRYLHLYQVKREELAGAPILAHRNALTNPNAMFHSQLDEQKYAQAEETTVPLKIYDTAPYADGAAAVIVTTRENLPAHFPHPVVKISGSSVICDTLALHDRAEPLAFDASGISAERACYQAGIKIQNVDFLEFSDLSTIHAILFLESSGLAKRGEGWKMLRDKSLELGGKYPSLTMGGCKGRGHPVGATGLFQAVEATLQLRGLAGQNQVKDARCGLIQCLGGPAATAITHILERVE